MKTAINNNNYEIHITTKDTTTHAVMKKDGEVIKRSMAKLHPDDKFDFEVGVNLCMGRLFEEEKFKPYLRGKYGSSYGVIGTSSNITALFGEPLFLGDMVEIYNVTSKRKNKVFVVCTNYNNLIGIMGIHGRSVDMKNGIADTWQVRKIKSYKDLVHGETDDCNVKVILKEEM